jgi:uncharacterized iron-regulated protein
VKSLARIALFASLFCPLALLASQDHFQPNRAGSEPVPEPAIPAVIAAFDKYDVVGMPEGHGMKDVDDFILSLIRHPAFAEKVNDIAVECGNSLYQPVLDHYIAGEDVSFAEVRKVWRNTTQPMCDTSAFFEQLFPLVRAINQKLPAGKRLRVLAGDPPIDWDQVKTVQDINKFRGNRDESIASVMEKEVLSKHRKALMLFGTYHLMHGVGPLSAVSIYEKDYPGLTFVINGFGTFDTSGSAFAKWPMPAVARAKGTWLGALDISHFYPMQVYADKDCNVHTVIPNEEQKPMAELVDAFLYVGPRDLALREQMPADIALDFDYMTEMIRRAVLQGYPGASSWTVKDMNQQIVNGAEYPLLGVPRNPDPKVLEQDCLAHKNANSTSK